MSVTVNIDEAALKRVRQKLKDLERPLNKKESNDMGSQVIKEMKNLVSKGISPIVGAGLSKRFEPYHGSYRKQIKDRGRVDGYRKALRPVNLKLSGAFLKSLRRTVTKRSGGGWDTVIGFNDELSEDKETGHREGANNQRKRPIIPEGNETFAQRIQLILLRHIKESVDRIRRRKN